MHGKYRHREILFSDYANDYLHVADQRSELSRLTRQKQLQKLSMEERKQNFLQKTAHPFLEELLAETDVVFRKTGNILCAFEVLNADNLNKQQSNLVNLFEPSI